MRRGPVAQPARRVGRRRRLRRGAPVRHLLGASDVRRRQRLSECGGDAGCMPVTCAQLGAQCGPCPTTVAASSTAASAPFPKPVGEEDFRAGAGTGPNQRRGVCVPLTCSGVDAGCGRVADGCGGLTASCGTVHGRPGVWRRWRAKPMRHDAACRRPSPSCKSTAAPVSDGCGTLFDAGSTCPVGQTCGGGAGGGRPNVCGGSSSRASRRRAPSKEPTAGR